jgi:hypothetical protein
LSGSAPAFAPSRDIASARRIAAPFAGHFLCCSGRDAVFCPYKWQRYIVGDGYCCLPEIEARLLCRRHARWRLKQYRYFPVATSRASQPAFQLRQRKVSTAGTNERLQIQLLPVLTFPARFRSGILWSPVFAADEDSPSEQVPSPIVSTAMFQRALDSLEQRENILPAAVKRIRS